MSCLYILISIVLLIVFILTKKIKDKANIVLWLAISVMLLICLNIFITLIFNAIHIKSTLTNISIVYICIIAVLGYKIKKDRKIQKYYIKKADILMLIAMTVTVIAIGIKQFGVPFNIAYQVTDASTHYLSALEFYEKSDLLGYIGITDFKTFMTGAYVNCGILFKSLSSIINEKDFIQIFISFDLAVLWLSGILFYSLINNINCDGSKNKSILAFVFTFLYIFGYSLNSTISGFCYFLIGLNIIITIMSLTKYMKENTNIVILISMSLLSLGLFFSYYYFVPIIYFSLLIFLVEKHRKKITINNMMEIIYVLIVPAIFGIYYFFLRGMIENKFNNITESLTIPGAIYSNIITNFIVFIPCMLIYILRATKNKENNIIAYITVLEVLFIAFLGLGNILGKVSEYYFYKSYYLLWILALITTYYTITSFKPYIAYILTGTYVLGLFVGVGIFNNSIAIYDIYKHNNNILNEDYISIDYNHFDIVEYYNENLKKIDTIEDGIYIVASDDFARNQWMNVLYKNRAWVLFDLDFKGINDWVEKYDSKYLIYYKKDLDDLEQDGNFELDENNENYSVLIKNSTGAILKRK